MSQVDTSKPINFQYYIIQTLRKIKKVQDSIDKRFRMLSKNSSDYCNSSQEQLNLSLKKYNPFPKKITFEKNMFSKSIKPKQLTDTKIISTTTHLDANNKDLKQIPSKKKSYKRKLNQDTRQCSLPVIEEQAEDNFEQEVDKGKNKDKEDKLLTEILKQCNNQVKSNPNYEHITKFNMIKMFSRHPDFDKGNEHQSKKEQLNDNEQYDYLLKNYQIAPLSSDVFDEMQENICMNTGNGNNCYFDFNSGSLRLDNNLTTNINKFNKTKKSCKKSKFKKNNYENI